ncbi:allantoinase AllB [Cohnella nanjingensis]|uniref:Allantoinase n=1 Tax=Cohnella nanjingensis TaxID=1387779 RepID=A0A7X0RZN3_9BACL|nr:allantoinase AllB [Cohnella nanjingensis]MBB6675451.1 allantoinase AllB [Cohnella nanjingensis]
MDDGYEKIVRGGQVVLPGEVREWDIGIRDGRIAALAERLEAGEETETIDASGLWVLPGMVDAHVHLNEPAMGHWEGFATGTAALAAGGCTSFVDMPLNGLPPTVNIPALRLKEAAAEGACAIDYAFWGGLVPGNLDQLETLHREGVAAFKAFLSNPGGEAEERFREIDDVTLYEGMKRIASFGGLLALHAESEAITARLSAEALAAGRNGPLDFAATRPAIAELEAVGRALLFARETGCRLHFVHISTPEAAALIDKAKREGQDVTVETCPHYLALTERDMAALGPVAKCAPPLRDEVRQERLWALASAGGIDLVASDHSPCPEALKSPADGSFFGAWGGIAGAQSSLEVMLHEGAFLRGIPLQRIAALVAGMPAKRFGLYPRKGEIAVGFDADLALVDPKRAYTLRKEDLLQRHPHSPYIGRTFSCRVTATYVRGKLVYALGSGIVAPGGGIRLRPETRGKVPG